MLLRNANVLDESGGFTGPQDILVDDGVITAVGSGLPGGDAQSIDLEGLFLMPGVFDCHTHIGFSTLDMTELLNMSITEWTLEAARNLRNTLEGGVTYIRDAGAADAGIRNAVRRGVTLGPEMKVAIAMIGQTGGQGDGFLPGPGIEMTIGNLAPDFPGRPRYLADGRDEVRKAVRESLRAGADWVKVLVSGGALTPTGAAHMPEYTFEEVEVAVEEAARRGKRVMADAKAADAIKMAVRAGIGSVEHGVFLDEEGAALMAEKDCWLVPTHAVYRDLVRWGEAGKLPPDQHQRAIDQVESTKDFVQIARAAGVKIALGTDFIVREQHGRNLEQITLLHEAGMPADEVLLAATIRGAELLGVDDRYGRIAEGYVFDAIVLDEDPSDPALFAKPGCVTGVFKAGVPVVEHPRLDG
jgi:imidazolonepropionase-like amidohydrolase